MHTRIYLLVLICAFTAAHVRIFEEPPRLYDPAEDSSDEINDSFPRFSGNIFNKTDTTISYTTVKSLSWLRSFNYNPVQQSNTSTQSTSTQSWTPTVPWSPRSKPNHSNEIKFHCEPEPFHHDYIVAANCTKPATNIWKRAKAGERAGLHELCLKPNGLPLTRKCRYNAQQKRAEWEDISIWPRIACIRQPSKCFLSSKLNTLHEQLLTGTKLDRNAVTTQLTEMVRNKKYHLLPADVHFTSQILRELTAETQDPALAENVVSICDRMISSDARILRISADINATNALLETFESYMDAASAAQVPTRECRTTVSSSLIATPVLPQYATEIQHSIKNGAVETIRLGHIGVTGQLSANLSVFYVNPSCANISGIAIYAPRSHDNLGHHNDHRIFEAYLGHFRYRFIYMNESVEVLMQEPDLEIASFVPTSLWRKVNAALLHWQSDVVVVLKLYAYDTLFVETTLVQTRKPFSKVLSISIPGYEGPLPEELPFLLRSQYAHVDAQQLHAAGTGCGYWNYSTWISTGVHTNSCNSQYQPVIRCGTQHLTQFSFLLGGTYRQSDVSNDVLVTPLHMRVLDIISLVGCSLSLLGLLGIWLTAALSKNWRALASTKVLLNLCLALTLQMFLFVFINTDDLSEHLVEHKSYTNCLILGAALQYSILVLFMWMLIVALLQFQRYVTIIGIERPHHYILKAAVLAWGLPLIPTLLVVFIDPSSYIPTDYQLQSDTGICYPSGLGLTLSVVVPVTVIVVANLTIFMYVFYSISHSLNQALHRHEKQIVIKQVRLSVLLFFLLGISWIFGLFAYMGAGTVFSYLFCLTATLQGFVLFVYFVLLDELTRNAWLQLFCAKRQQKNASKRSNEMASMTASTGLESRDGNSLPPHAGRNTIPQQPSDDNN